MVEPWCGYVNGFTAEDTDAVSYGYLLYSLHSTWLFTAVPGMAALLQRMPATTTSSHDNRDAQVNNTRNTPQFTMQRLQGKRLHQKWADRYMDFHYTYKLDLNGTQKVMQNI